MTLEVNQIKVSSEAAIAGNAEQPNFSEVYKNLNNNTTAQEQKDERTAFNEVLHKTFPTIDLIGQDKLTDQQGNTQEALIVFDRTTNHVQMRSVQDFSVLQEKDMSPQVKQQNATAEQASAFLGSKIDESIEKQAQQRAAVPNAQQERSATVAPNPADTTRKTDNPVPPVEGTKPLEGTKPGADKKAPDQIKSISEAALTSKPEKPNFSEVFKALSNNTTVQEQKNERTAFNQVLHTKYPNLDLVGHEKLSDQQGKSHDALVVFDKETNHIQARSANDFSVLSDTDISEKVKASKMTADQVSQVIGSDNDKKIAEAQAKLVNPAEANKEKSTANPTEKAQQGSPTEQIKEKAYVVKQGDCLWNIAKAHLRETDPEAKDASNVSIRKYVDKIVARNRKHIKDEDLIYPGQKFILPELTATKVEQKVKPGDPTAKPGDPIAKPGDPTAKPGDPTAKPGDPTAKPGDPTAKPGDPTAKPGDPTAKPGDPTAKPGDPTVKPSDSPVPPVFKPSEQPSTPDIFGENRNAIPQNSPESTTVKPTSVAPSNDF